MSENKQVGAVIAEVYPDTLASRLGLVPGDRIVALNGRKVRDLIEFQWEWAEEEVWLSVVKADGKNLRLNVEKEYDEGFGALFEEPVFDGLRLCANRCLFCFVDQMAPDCRKTLYVKDDDYRLSFLQGSFVTLTNLTEGDIERICREKLSPLYVSVHATEPETRNRLLGRKGRDRLMEILRRLDQQGIQFHCQVVLCPGLNDGPILERTFQELLALEGALTLAVVPVGLTKFRESLPDLPRVDKAQARQLISWLEAKQKEALAVKGSRFVWLSDEFYVLADQEVPGARSYEGYPQLENGVGLIRCLLEEAEFYDLPEVLPEAKTLNLAGGVSAMRALTPLWRRLERVRGLRLNRLPLVNRFFGPQVNVSGLLTGHCLIGGLGEALSQGKIAPGEKIYLPEVMIRDKGDSFVDGISVKEVEERLGLSLEFLPSEGDQLLAALLG